MLPEATQQPSRAKGTLGIWIGVLLLVGGIVLAAWVVVDKVGNVGNEIDAYQRVPVSTGGTVQIDETGTYRLFLERPGADQEVSSTLSLAVSVWGPDGEPVAVLPDSMTETYDIGGHTGRNIGKFRARATGPYRLRPIVGDGSSAFGEIAVTRRGPLGGLAGAIGGVLGGALLALIGVIVLILSAVRRGRSRRAAAGPPGSALPGWAPPPTPGWAPAPTQAWTPPPAPGGWTPPPPQGWAPPPAPGGWSPPPAPPTAPGAPPSWTPPPPAPPVWTPPPSGPSAPPTGPPDEAGPIS